MNRAARILLSLATFYLAVLLLALPLRRADLSGAGRKL